MSSPRKFIFLDRDGTIIHELPPYGIAIRDQEEVRIIPSVPEQLARLITAGYELIAVTNQANIARGLTTTLRVNVVHREIKRRLTAEGVTVRAFYTCPHAPKQNCKCRKPEPGLLLQAQKEFAIDMQQSWIIGDRATDARAGLAAGCRGAVIVESEHEYVRADQQYPDNPHCHVVTTMREAVDTILGETSV